MTALVLPNAKNARLPVVYEQAKEALAECSRIDECKDWANKAEALASYARQADDDSLRKTADRIQARAIQRCGELLKQIEKTAGRPKNGAAADTKTHAARSAGLSKRQQVTATRVANVDKDLFESLVESEDPPTVTELAERGKTKKPIEINHLKGRSEADFKASVAGTAMIRDSLAFAERTDPKSVVRGSLSPARRQLAGQLPVLIGWLSDMLSFIEEDL